MYDHLCGNNISGRDQVVDPLHLSVWNEGLEKMYIDYETAAMATFFFYTTKQEIILHAISSPIKSIQNYRCK